MAALLGSVWVGALVVLVLVALLVGLFLRYRALDRAGSALPPGTGGARLVGVVGDVVAPHDPAAGTRGVVTVLGDRWGLADQVTDRFEVGEAVRVTEVVGTRLVVVATTVDPGDRRSSDGGATPRPPSLRPDATDGPTRGRHDA